MEAGLINKSDGSYSHTDTWKYHLSEIFEWINARNSRYKAGEDDPDTLTCIKQFSETTL